MTLVSLFGLGLLIGVISSIFGVGGGFIMVPVLYFLFPDQPPPFVVGTSLGVIFLNSLINSNNFKKLGKMTPKKALGFMGATMACGVVLGGMLTGVLPPKQVKLIFGITTGLVAIKTFFSNGHNPKGDNGLLQGPNFLMKGSLFSFLGGIISGLTGLGGGAILVPLMLTFLKVPFTWISVVSNNLMAIGTGFGLLLFMFSGPSGRNQGVSYVILEHLQVGQVNLGIILLIFLGALKTSKLGVKWGHSANPRLLKNLFAIMLSIISVRILIKALS